MKWKKTLLGILIAVIAVVSAKALVIYQTTLINEASLAYAKNYEIDLQSVYAGSNLAGTVAYSTAALGAQTFSDGAQSTGSFTVSSVSGLTCTQATNAITVASN